MSDASSRFSMEYEQLFKRNFGVFTREEQERLKRTKVLIVGCGGIGGTVALLLARSGVGAFVLVDIDTFEPTNMNRQIGCFEDTLGKNKADVIREQIRKINSKADVVSYNRLLSLDMVSSLMLDCDFVFPAADDYAYSLMVFRAARRKRKLALMIVPAGFWSIVTLIRDRGPTAESLHGVPALKTYEELRELFQSREAKQSAMFFTSLGGFRKEYFREYVEADAPPAQLAPAVFLASSLGALEALKAFSRREKPVYSPHFWMIDRNGIRKCHSRRMNAYSLFVTQRRIGWKLLNSPLGGLQKKVIDFWWKRFIQRGN